MAKTKSLNGISLLYGLTFLSPVTYSILAYEMDVIQRMFFFALSIVLFLVFIAKYKTDKPIQANEFLSALIIIFPLSLLTALFNGSASLLVLKFSDIVVPFFILLQSAFLLLILGEDRFLKVVSYSVIIISTLFSIIGIFEVFQIYVLQLPSVRPPGSTSGHRSFASEYLLPSLPFFLIVKEYVKKESKIILFIASIINVSFFLFTRNRSGIIILFVIILLYLAFILLQKERRNKLKSSAAVLGAIIISFIISLIPAEGTERPDIESTVKTIFDSEFKSNVFRINFWDASLQMIEEKPFTGAGLYKWSGYYPKYKGDYFNDNNLTYIHNIHAHNDFLELGAESGILSSLIYLLIYITTAYLLFRKMKLNEKYFPLLLSFLSTFAFSFAAFPNYKFSSFFLAAVIAGTVLIKTDVSEKQKFSFSATQLKLIMIVLIIFGTISSFIRLQSELRYGEAIFLKERNQFAFMLQKLEDVSEILYPFDASKQPVDYYRAIANYYLGRYSEALNNNLSALELAPYNPLIIRNTAGLYQAVGNKKESINYYEEIRKYFPDYIDAQINLLYLYSEMKQSEDEKILFDELIKKAPENPRLLEYKNKFHSE